MAEKIFRDADGNQIDVRKLPRIRLDSDEDADWPKRTWDFPHFCTPEGYPPPDDDPGWPAFVKSFDMSFEEFKLTTAYRFARRAQQEKQSTSRSTVESSNPEIVRTTYEFYARYDIEGEPPEALIRLEDDTEHITASYFDWDDHCWRLEVTGDTLRRIIRDHDPDYRRVEQDFAAKMIGQTVLLAGSKQREG